jgi:hypothetical protein
MIHRSYGFHTDSATGPYLYVQWGPLMLHCYARWFRLPWQHGWHWGYTLRAGDHWKVGGTR